MVLLAASARSAEPPAPIVDLFRAAAEELASPDAEAFLDHFDRDMPGYLQLKIDIEDLLVHGYAVSTIEFESDQGDDQRRDLEVDWLWRQSDGPQHHAILKCRVERRGKAWKITRLEPVDFFRR